MRCVRSTVRHENTQPEGSCRATLLYMRRLTLVLLLCLGLAVPAFAQKLTVYTIDVDGGNATLIVTPEKESLLSDAGWPNSPDADRIAATAKAAGISKIDYLLVTHYHVDHVGGVPELLRKIPVAHVIDHGPSVEHERYTQQLVENYEKAIAKIPRIVVKAGDKIPLKGAEIEVVAAGGALIKPAAGSPANPLCRSLSAAPKEDGENDQSIGFVLNFGKFRMVDLADLTLAKEPGLLCPANALGHADVFLVSHHGFDHSNSQLLIDSLHPRAAIMKNGARKGGSPGVVKAIYASPGVETLWQLHSTVDSRNAPEKFIANPEEKCQGYGIKLTAAKDGSFTVTNLRNGYSVDYPAK